MLSIPIYNGESDLFKSIQVFLSYILKELKFKYFDPTHQESEPCFKKKREMCEVKNNKKRSNWMEIWL